MKNTVTRVFESCKRGVRWAWEHKLRLAVLGLVLALIAPRPAKSQFLDPCCAILAAGLSSITSTLNHVVGGGLNNILSVDQNMHTFQQTNVWPLAQIGQALVPRRHPARNQHTDSEPPADSGAQRDAAGAATTRTNPLVG